MRKHLLVLSLAVLSQWASAAQDALADFTDEFGDVLKISRRPDGNFDVLCRDGKQEIRTELEVSQGTVCKGTPPVPVPTSVPISDFWDPRYCTESPITEQQAFAKIPVPQNTEIYFTTVGKIAVRQRFCLSVDGCLEWNQRPAGLAPSTTHYPVYDKPVFKESAHYIVSASLGETGGMRFYLDKNRTKMYFYISGISFFSLDFASSSNPTFTGPYLGKKQYLAIDPYDKKIIAENYYQPNWVGTFGNHCFRYTTSNIVPIIVGSGNDGHVLQEVVLYGRY